VDTHWFLRNEGKVLSIVLNVEFRDGVAINQDISGQRIIESLNELDTVGICKGNINK